MSKNIPAQSFAVTLGDIYNQWSAKKYSKAGAASIASYKASWARISPLSDKEMCKITLDDLQGIIDKDEAAESSKSSINNDRTLMKALFKHAMERDIVSKDYSAFSAAQRFIAKYEKGAFDDITMKKLEQLAQLRFSIGRPPCSCSAIQGSASQSFCSFRFSYHAKADGYLQGGIKTDAGERPDRPSAPEDQAVYGKVAGPKWRDHYL